MSNRNVDLNNEFTDDPLGYGYLGMTDQQRYDTLVLEDLAIFIPIQSEIIIAQLEYINKWSQMNQLAVIDQSKTPPVPRNDTAYHSVLVMNSFSSFDMEDVHQNQILTNLMAALVSNNILTQAEADAILANGDSFESRDTQINVPNVTIGEVEDAR